MPGKERRFTRVNVADKKAGRTLAGRAVCSRKITIVLMESGYAFTTDFT
jgi:hypothetical protein